MFIFNYTFPIQNIISRKTNKKKNNNINVARMAYRLELELFIASFVQQVGRSDIRDWKIYE